MSKLSDRLLKYGSIFVAVVTTLISAQLGGIYVSLILARDSQAIGIVHLVSAMTIAIALGFVFKRATPRYRFLIAFALLISVILAMPRHNCGTEC